MNLKETFRTMVSITADDSGAVPTKIQIMPLGVYDSPTHGQFNILSSDAQEYIDNFINGGYRTEQLPIDLDHGGAYGENSEAAGWITDLELVTNAIPDTANGVYATVSWTPLGEQKLISRQYRYFSPEFCPTYMDGVTGEMTGNVLIGGGLVNRPFFRDMQPVVAHDGTKPKRKGDTSPIKLFINANERQDMKLTTILSKDPKKITSSEQGFLKDHATELTTDQRTAFSVAASAESETIAKVVQDDVARQEAEREAALVTEVTEPNQEVEEVVVDDPSTTDETVTTKTETGEPGVAETTPVQASEKVTITAAEKLAMEAKIVAGEKAILEMRTLKAGEKVRSWLFNDKGTGKFTPRIASDVTDFYLSLNATQAQSFEVLVEKMPNVKLFAEMGKADSKSGAGALTASDQMTKLADEAYAVKITAGEKAEYVSVFKETVRAHADLAKQIDEEQAAQKAQATV